MAKADITASSVRELFQYDPDTGSLSWRNSGCGRTPVGVPIASKTKQGYLFVRTGGRFYAQHRLAWLYCYGEWPVNQIDHINGNRADNRIANLRDVPNRVNAQNRREARGESGVLGVFPTPSGKWRSTITVDGQVISIGIFDTKEAASEEYLRAKRKLHEGCTL